jgi:hypothetical protein
MSVQGWTHNLPPAQHRLHPSVQQVCSLLLLLLLLLHVIPMILPSYQHRHLSPNTRSSSLLVSVLAAIAYFKSNPAPSGSPPQSAVTQRDLVVAAATLGVLCAACLVGGDV